MSNTEVCSPGGKSSKTPHDRQTALNTWMVTLRQQACAERLAQSEPVTCSSRQRRSRSARAEYPMIRQFQLPHSGDPGCQWSRYLVPSLPAQYLYPLRHQTPHRRCWKTQEAVAGAHLLPRCPQQRRAGIAMAAWCRPRRLQSSSRASSGCGRPTPSYSAAMGRDERASIMAQAFVRSAKRVYSSR